MAQPTRMPGTAYHAASSRQRMLGRFIQSPTCREYSGYDWRTSSPTYKRFKKRALSRFRRRDGKRWILEGLALIAEQEADEQARLDQERYWYDEDPDYGYSCCPECDYGYLDLDERYHDGVDYTDEYEYVVQEWERYYDEYVQEWSYERGYRDGYSAAMGDFK